MLLDDVFSAVDGHVAKHLLASVASCKRKKTIVLCTNSMLALPECDHVIVLSADGRIVGQGTYEQVSKNANVDLFGAKIAQSTKNESNESNDLDRHQESEAQTENDEKSKKIRTKLSTLMTKEERETGDVSKAAYMYYVRAAGIPLVIGVLVSGLAARAGDIVAPFWLAEWEIKRRSALRLAMSLLL